MAGGSQPYKQKMSAKMSTTDKFCSKSSGADKYSKSTTQNKYLTKTDAGAKYSSVKKTASDKYSCGPAGEKYSVTKKSSEDKYSKSNGMDTHLKAKTSSKDTYVKGAEKKQDYNKPFSSQQQQQQQQNQKTFSSKTADSKKDKMFCEKEVHTGTWTSRPYNKEIKNANKDDRNRGLNALGTGAVAGVGVLAAAGPRKRDIEREKERRNNGHHNGVNNRDEKGRERDERRAQHNNAIPTEGASDGCCILL